MTINRVDIEDDLSPILAAILPAIPIISESEDAPRPSTAYIAYKATDFRQIGQEQHVSTDDDGLSTYKTIYSLKIKFTGINDNTGSNLATLAFALVNNPIVIDDLSAAGFDVTTAEVFIQDQPAFRNGVWEQDDLFNLDVNYTDLNTVDTSYIGSTDITGIFYEPGTQAEDYPTSDPARTINITIPT